MANPEQLIQARRAADLYRVGLLSTQSLKLAGYPFGSLVPYDIDQQGRVIIRVSPIAEHSRNLAKDGRASLCIAEPFPSLIAQTAARLTIMLAFSLTPAEEREEVAANYQRRFPEQLPPEVANTFIFLRGEPEYVRWIGGFGAASWIPGERFRAQERDLIAYEALPVLARLNMLRAKTIASQVAANLGVAVEQIAQVAAIDLSQTTLTVRAVLQASASPSASSPQLSEQEVELKLAKPINSATEIEEQFLSNQ